MRFVIHADVLDGDDAALALVDSLIDRVADEVHRVDMPDADRLVASRWYEEARSVRRKVLTEALSSPPRSDSGRSGLHSGAVDVCDMATADRARRVAYAPLILLVEDREADGVLVEILVEELGSAELRALWERSREVTPRAVEIDTAGGVGAMPARVERILADAAEEGRPARLFVLCDSDVRWPGDGTEAADRVRERCDDNGVPCHVLHKRTAESYIPDRTFEAVRDDPRNAGNVDRFDAPLGLSRVQRDHFPIKDGLSARERAAAIEAGLYQPSEEATLKLLEGRLLPKRPRPLLLLHRERRATFTAPGLRARDGRGELDALLQAIEAEL